MPLRPACSIFTARNGSLAVSHDRFHLVGAKVAYADMPNTVKAVEVGKLLGVVWGDVTSDLVKHARFKPLLAGIGWAYVPGRGRGGSRFDRITAQRALCGVAPGEGSLLQRLINVLRTAPLVAATMFCNLSSP